MCLALLGILLAAQVSAEETAPSPPGWREVMASAERLEVTARPWGVSAALLSGVNLLGAWVLTADGSQFGGFSGLVFRDGRVYMVSDIAWWFGSEFEFAEGTPVMRNAAMAPILDPNGRVYGKSSGDAEGLAWSGNQLVVAFERVHRLMYLGEDGRMSSPVETESFGQLRSNKGVEALASLPGGGLIALAEGRDHNGAPVYVFGPDGRVAEALLPVSWLHEVTGADVGPDGRLYLVLREFSALFGLSIRVMRYELGDDGMPLEDSAETLAAFEADSGIDNMEGIAVEARPDGSSRLWLVSDDNFRDTQRTLLVGLEILP